MRVSSLPLRRGRVAYCFVREPNFGKLPGLLPVKAVPLRPGFDVTTSSCAPLRSLTKRRCSERLAPNSTVQMATSSASSPLEDVLFRSAALLPRLAG